MATKAKLSLSQLLFRRTSTSNNGYVNGGNNNSGNGVSKSDHCAGHGDSSSSSYNGHGSRKVSSSSVSSSGRSGFYEISSPPDILPQKVDHVQQQLHGILKKPNRNDVDNSGGCKLIKSTLHRSRSNPNPSNNPLKEVSWSCPTLEKRREVILNYFERIILENKQEQNGKMRTKPNIPCESERDSSGGEPIYEEISDCKSFNNSTTTPDKMGSLKPKVMPKKVRMNIPQDQRTNTNGSSPIYDKVLCRSHSMIEPPVASSYDTVSSSASSCSSSTISSQSIYENFRPVENDYGNRRAGRSHSFHDNFRPVSSSSNNNNIEHYNIQVDSGDPEQLYAKVCKRKKIIKVSDHDYHNENERQEQPYKAVNGGGGVVDDELRVQVSCANVVTMIPVIMPCSSSFSTSCLSLSSSSDNNNDDTTTTTRGNNNYVHHLNHHHHNDDNEEHYTEKILPDKEIAYVKCDNRSRPNNRNNLSVIHLLATYDPAKEMEEFIPTTPSSSSFTAIIDSTECAPRSISIPVRGGEYNNNHHNNANKGIVSNADSSSSHSPASSTTPLMVTNCSFGFSDEHHHRVGLVVSDTKSVAILSASDDEDEDDVTAKYEIGRGKGLSTRSGARTITQVESDTTKDLLLLTSDSEDDICETKSILSIMNSDLIDVSSSLPNGKYIPDDEDRGFDSFLDDNDSGLADKNENPFKAENLRNQRTFSQLQQDVPQDALKKKAASVLDLINSEISDLHMRELELKKIHGSSPIPPSTKLDKEDHHGTNLEEFEEGSSEDDFSDSAIEYDGFTTNGSNSSGQVSPSQNLSEVVQQEEQERILLEKTEDARPSENRVRPLLEEEDKTIKFDVTQETPIEREIRVTRDREEEFRRLNKLSTQTTSLPVMVQRSESKVENTSFAKPNNVASRPENLDKSSDAPKKDVQYRMATDRLKREIEESMQREKELMLEGRLKKGDDESINDEPSPVAEPEKEEKTTKQEEVSSPPPPAVVQEGLRKPTLAKPITKMPAARFFSPPAYNGNKPNRITPVVSPIINKGRFDYPTSSGDRVVGGSLPIGINRPNFTSLEKYILQSSYNYNNAKSTEEQVIRIAESIKQQPIIPEDPLRIIQKPNTDEDAEEDNEEEEKPKRRYIPAQDKIHKEIEELAMREKELTITRAKWKSTLDLPESFDDDVNEVNTHSTSTMSLDIRSSSARGDDGGSRDPESPAQEIVLEEQHKQPADENKKEDDEDDDVFKVKVPPRRRHSVLISQWEERIRQQQQTTNKK